MGEFVPLPSPETVVVFNIIGRLRKSTLQTPEAIAAVEQGLRDAYSAGRANVQDEVRAALGLARP